ncbi:hypothetical protein QQS21_011429 [Conoideocrella luteorostrata]|uniref:Nucleoside phosphorylase domain-containing protein n=1 Tax=Conoideocrella luteorostrata TaxID=1105319 RepID=A0AAJ0CDE7_9HYPO|nr:hypothetical protein QQS21_011429 [Conoideocrella luteorostrata]
MADYLDTEIYRVAWIAPLEVEARAATLMLDKRHFGRIPQDSSDDYVYRAGEMCGHNVVIAAFPPGQHYGVASAADLAGRVKTRFPNIRFGLLVGVAAGIPSPSRDIRLGDVLVATAEREIPALTPYGLGREGKDKFQLLVSGRAMPMTASIVRSAIGIIKGECSQAGKLFLPYYEKIKDEECANGTFHYPGQDLDHLHGLDSSGNSYLIERTPRPDDQRTKVWYGNIGSGDTLMKDATKRDELAGAYDLIGLEMEAAGAMNVLPVGVIRGVCDYADEHKNEERALVVVVVAVLSIYLSSRDAGHWLLVVDNADELVMVTGESSDSPGLPDFLPRSEWGRTLVTTRSFDAAFNIVGHNIIELTGMTLEDATVFMEKAVSHPRLLKEKSDISSLLDKLTYLPLTIGQAVAYMTTNNVSVSQYLRLCDKTSTGLIGLLKQLHDESYHSKSQGAVATTWIISFDAICKASHGAAKLLSFLQWIGPKDIPLRILPTLEAEGGLIAAINVLCSYRFMSWREDGQTVDMHHLVHLALKTWLAEKPDQFMTQDNAIKHIAESIPTNTRENRPVWHQFMDHVLPIVLGPALVECSNGADLGYMVACRLQQFEMSAEAIEVLQKLIGIYHDRASDGSDQKLLEAQHTLVAKYVDHSYLEQGKAFIQQMMTTQNAIMSPEHPEQHKLRFWLARIDVEYGRVTAAIPELEHVVRTQDQISPNLRYHGELGRAYVKDGQTKKAIKLLEDAVNPPKALPEDHYDQIMFEYALAEAYGRINEVERSMALIEQVVSMQKTLPETHPARVAPEGMAWNILDEFKMKVRENERKIARLNLQHIPASKLDEYVQQRIAELDQEYASGLDQREAWSRKLSKYFHRLFEFGGRDRK